MPRYYFDLNDGRRIMRDPDGMEMADAAAAQCYAREVAAELMRNRAARTAIWRLVVRGNDREECFQVSFYSLDDSIAHLAPEIRSSIEEMWRQAALLSDAVFQIRTTLHQVKGTIAQADRTPYLAVLDGVRL
jgi:hypothetical protein